MSQNEENIEVMKDIRNRLDAVLNKDESTTTKHPDALKHFQISMAKSILRLFAGGALVMGEFFIAGIVLILAELLGIVEELV